jgi:parallel beta-helix repeat protein
MKTKWRGTKIVAGALFLAVTVLYGGWSLVRESGLYQKSMGIHPRESDVSRPAVYIETGDGESINAAIRGLPPGGGSIVLGPSIFHISKSIVIDRDSVELRGVGTESILRLTDGANCSVVVIGSTTTPVPHWVQNVALRHLAIDGNRGAQEYECCGGPCDGGGLAFIRNNGITIRGSEDVQIENVATHNCRSGGVVLEKHCRRVHIKKLDSYNNEFDGLAAYETEDCSFTEMKLHHNRSAAVSLDWKFNRNVISDSHLTDNGSQGVFMRDSSDNLFKNLVMQNNGEQGIFMGETRELPGTPCLRNKFDQLTVKGNKTQGIRVNDASCVGNIVTNCVFTGNGQENISLADAGQLIGADSIVP